VGFVGGVRKARFLREKRGFLKGFGEDKKRGLLGYLRVRFQGIRRL